MQEMNMVKKCPTEGPKFWLNSFFNNSNQSIIASEISQLKGTEGNSTNRRRLGCLNKLVRRNTKTFSQSNKSVSLLTKLLESVGDHIVTGSFSLASS